MLLIMIMLTFTEMELLEGGKTSGHLVQGSHTDLQIQKGRIKQENKAGEDFLSMPGKI